MVHYLEGGHSANYIALVLRLTLAEVRALIQYIEEHKEEVMAVHRQIEERIARGNPPEIEERMAKSPAHLSRRWPRSSVSAPRRRTVKAILSDVNIEGHMEVLLTVLEGEDWAAALDRP